MKSRILSKGQLRRENILNVMKAQGRITVPQIMEQFQCSEATARRDLDVLAEKAGGVIRTLGGAQYEAFLSPRETSFQEKQAMSWLEKEAIAHKAASLIEEGDIIGLSGGTTTYLIAKAIKRLRHITVVTNAVNVAMELAESEEIQVVVTGGVMRGKSFELCGPLAQKTVEGLNIGKMFVGIDGLSIEQGLTTYSEQEAEIAKLLMQRTAHTIAVFDSSKAGKASLFSFAPLADLHACITDAGLDSSIEQYCIKHQVKLYLAGR